MLDPFTTGTIAHALDHAAHELGLAAGNFRADDPLGAIAPLTRAAELLDGAKLALAAAADPTPSL